MISEDRKKWYYDSLAVLFLTSPAYSMFRDFLNSVPLEDLKSGVAATDGTKIYIGPLYKQYNASEGAFIIAHELNHILLRHPWRSVGKDRHLYNIAGDYVINDTLHLKDLPNIPLPGKPIPISDFLNPQESKHAKAEADDMKGILYDESLKDYDTDAIYRMLENSKYRGQNEGEEGQEEGSEESSGQPSGKQGKQREGQENENGSINGGDVIENENEDSQDETVKKLRESVNKWRERQSGAGSGTDAEKRLLDLLDIKEILPWTAVLQRYLKSLVASNYTWSPPKAIYLPPGTAGNIPNTYVPRLRERTIRIAVAIDTSSSIGNADLNVFLTNIRAMFNAILMQAGYSGILMLTTDRVYSAFRMPPVPSVDTIVSQMLPGGTDFVPAFKFIEEYMQVPPDVFIYFTDGDGKYPDKAPRYDVLWLLTPNSTATPPFGNVIRFSY